MQDLAIVIPAYKPDYLYSALESLSAQSDQRFTLYIGDDASPHKLGELVSACSSRLDLHYFRFQSNLGSSDLAAQWTRCVELSTEPWVWLFSDDDLATPDCVAAVYRFLDSAASNVELLHFQTDMVDVDSNLLSPTRAHPTYLAAYEFALGRLRFHWSSFATEYIFSRQAWVRCGGFVHVPAAWCADDASWIRLAGSSGIITLLGGHVQWRQSDRNITAGNSPYTAQKTEAMLMYMTWLTAHFQTESAARKEALHKAFHEWFFTLFAKMNPLLSPGNMMQLHGALNSHLCSNQLRIAADPAANEYFALRATLKRLLYRFRGTPF